MEAPGDMSDMGALLEVLGNFLVEIMYLRKKLFFILLWF